MPLAKLQPQFENPFWNFFKNAQKIIILKEKTGKKCDKKTYRKNTKKLSPKKLSTKNIKNH